MALDQKYPVRKSYRFAEEDVEKLGAIMASHSFKDESVAIRFLINSAYKQLRL